jgi:hypothetical protein
MKLVPAVAVICLLATCAMAQTIMKKEPASGEVKAGQRILVDDGTCPKGEIKEVVGGDNSKNIKRQRRCIPRR